MPSDFRGRIVSMGPDTVLERPALGLMVANVVCHWRSIEEGLELIYSCTLRALIAKNRQSHGVTDILSRQVLDTLYVTQQKLAVVKAALNRLDDQSFHDRLTKLERKISALGGERNQLLHSTWGVCDDYPDDLIIFARKGMLVYRQSDLADILARMRAMGSALMAIVADMPEARMPARRRNPPKAP